MEGFKINIDLHNQTIVYDNAYMFVLDLFDRQYSAKKEIDHFSLLCTYLDYYVVNKDELALIREIIQVHIKDWKQWDDAEHATLVLMQKLKTHEILLLIDNVPLVDLTKSIVVSSQNHVMFLNMNKIEDLSFN